VSKTSVLNGLSKKLVEPARVLDLMTVAMKVSFTKSQNQIILNDAAKNEILFQPSSGN
jgi:hypothetical protein